MLRGIRTASTGWLGRLVMTVVMGTLIVSFAIWGIGDIFRGFGAHVLAKVGKTEITIESFRQSWNDQLQQISRRVGHPVSPADARAMGLDQQLLGRLVGDAALDQQARELRLGISNEAIAESITADPAFRGLSGRFERQQFEGMIRQAGYNEQRYIAEQRKVSLRRQITESIAGAVPLPSTMAEIVHRYDGETRAIEFITLDAAKSAVPAPSDDTLKSYYESRKVLFRAPEYRSLAIIDLSPDKAAQWVDIPEAEVRKVYEDRRSRFTTDAQKAQTFEQLAPSIKEELVRSRARTEVLDRHDKIEDARAGGATIVETAKKLGLDLIEIEAVDRSGRDPSGAELNDIPNKNDLLAGAFAATVNAEIEPISVNGGYVFYEVLKVTPSRERSYDEVKDKVAARYVDEEAGKALTTKVDALLAELKSGTKLVDIATREGVTVKTANDIQRQKPSTAIPPKVAEQVLRAARGTARSAQGIDPTERIIFRVTDITPPKVKADDPQIKQIEQVVAQSIETDLINQYLDALQKQVGLTINRQVMNQITGASAEN